MKPLKPYQNLARLTIALALTFSTITPVTYVTAVASEPSSVHILTCKKGTYKNSSGKCVSSPKKASSWPAGSSAKCGDGTYSFSQSRSGTCSHHGGVQIWR